MRTRSGLFTLAFLSGLVVAALSAPTAGAAAEHTKPAKPAVTVTPSTGLADGDVVRIRAVGVVPSALVRVIQCDTFDGVGQEHDCPDVTTTTSDAAGRVSLRLAVEDVVSRRNGESPFAVPVLCRGDTCRIYLVVGANDEVQQVLASDPLEFTGSPATISVRPATDLRDGQRVRVSGTAFGAAGSTVQIAEKQCIILSNDFSCNASPRVVTTRVTRNGTYAAPYRVQRQEGEEGLDCADVDAFNLYCFITVTVLDANGRPDRSFGSPDYYGGYPRVDLTFRPGGHPGWPCRPRSGRTSVQPVPCHWSRP